MKVYKIRHRETGEFYGSGKFSKRGKTWGNIGHAKLAYECHKHNLQNCEIVEYSTHESCKFRPTDCYTHGEKWGRKSRIWAIPFGEKP